MTKKLTGLLLIVILAASLCSFAMAEDSTIPALKLTVTPSMLTVYPPYMIFTAQLSFMPPITTVRLKADFYNFDLNAPSNTSGYIGSAYFDNTGKAVFSKQIPQGAYVALAKTVINGKLVESNKVEYKVP
ncbi:MAG: hypothetical protein K6U80_12205 [Firmicutes bacterium]|nr:hypothetical protein [Bacillota bacterium]